MKRTNTSVKNKPDKFAIAGYLFCTTCLLIEAAASFLMIERVNSTTLLIMLASVSVWSMYEKAYIDQNEEEDKTFGK